MKIKIELDAKDLRILRLLSQDATLSIQQLAGEVGLSNNPCWRRVKRLEEEGVIVSRVAVLDPVKLGYAATAFVSIRIKSHDVNWLTTFKEVVETIPEIVECHRMAGDTDYLLKVIIRDLSHYDQVYQSLISQVPGLSDVSSSFSMELMKSRVGPAI